MSVPNRIWVTLITGFLGSGKTTLLNRILAHPRMSQAAVIVNEFGEIGIDYDLVSRSDESVVQLANGCLCCTMRGDLIDTFRDLFIQRNAGKLPCFDRVVIETTGIADPAPVLQVILTHPMVVNHYALDGVVTTVDAINALSSLERFAECVKQAAIADRMVLTKADLVEGPDRERRLAAVRARLRALNPAAPIIESAAAQRDPSALFGSGLFDPATKAVDLSAWLRAEAYEDHPQPAPGAAQQAALPAPDGAARAYYRAHGHVPQDGSPVAPQADETTRAPQADETTRAPQAHGTQAPDADREQAVLAAHAHDPGIRSFCLVRERPMSLAALRMFLEGLGREAGPDLLRVKGIVHVAERPDRPAVIQGAQQVFHSLDWLAQWPSEDRRTRIVFITRGIAREQVEETFDLIERVAERTARAANRGIPSQDPPTRGTAPAHTHGVMPR
ncbi:MAG: GTP-binding protein [Burkholderiales bacterium]|nr:GTP-binding protein [Burkholderiales bacterium]